MLTGRKDAYLYDEHFGDVSGYTNPEESEHDFFNVGHTSTSVSLACGLAKARDLKGDNENIIAVIGDGSLSGGEALEGIDFASELESNFIIVVNDNGMSINSNVGGMAKLLSKERVKPGYINFKRWYKRSVGDTPIYDASHKLKEAMKKSILPSNMFDSMGIYYLGPVDGHDVEQLETVLRWAKEMKTTVLVHVLSKKGKGCFYAEAHPDKYHGVGQFDPVSGALGKSKPSFSSVFGKKLCELAENNNNIVAITAAMSSGTGLSKFSELYPDRFFDVGIAEQHAVSMAAGMAKQGIVPVVAIYSSFLQRAYDMLIHDVSLLNLHIVFCVDRAGLVGSDGETHHGVFDVSYLQSVPGMQILCPSSFAELEAMLEYAVNELDGPVAIRYPRGGEGIYNKVGEGFTQCIKQGEDISLAAYGTMINEMLELSEKLSADGISAEVIKINQITPLDTDIITQSLKKTGRLLIAEDVCNSGCMGNAILAEAEYERISLRGASICNLEGGIVSHGTVDELMRDCGLDTESLYKKAIDLVRGAM